MEHVSSNSLALITYVVERRPAIPAGDLPMLRGALTDACRRLTARGHSVRYLRSESRAGYRTLCFFKAVDADAVRTVNQNAQAPFVSIRELPKDTYLRTK
jgi:hypothetical protein